MGRISYGKACNGCEESVCEKQACERQACEKRAYDLGGCEERDCDTSSCEKNACDTDKGEENACEKNACDTGGCCTGGFGTVGCEESACDTSYSSNHGACYNTGAIYEKYVENGLIYDKCKFCGSIIFRQANVDLYAVSSDNSHVIVQETLAAEHAAVDYSPQAMRYDYKYAAGEAAKERVKGANAYGLRLNEDGCRGICIQHDTGACGGSCNECAVNASGLCCKRFLVNSKNANLLERDGGDYRNLMGDFIRRLLLDEKYDENIRIKLFAEAAKANRFRDAVRHQVVGANDRNLIFEWREYTLNDLLVLFPLASRRPVRIEMQLLIYLYHNFRFPIDLVHAETRFQIPRLAINRYLRSYFGYSYTSLLCKIRNEYSKTLLQIPMLRIGEIGMLVGYKSHYHYSLSFKRYEGISPKEYRQSIYEHAPHE